jgi:Uma2 family endonuclease
MDSGDPPKEDCMGKAALLHDDAIELDLRELADELLETRRVEYIEEGVLLVMNPPARPHANIVRLIVRAIDRAFVTGKTRIEWAVHSEHYQWDLPGGSGRFFVPDVVVIPPGVRTKQEESASIALVVEVTSPASADTVYNDRVVKPPQYAKGGVPLYLLVDQERAAWTLHELVAGEKPAYRLASSGKYGEDIALPGPFGFAIPTGEWPTPED